MLQQIIDDIDAEVAKRTSDKFGIRFSLDLFNALARGGKIKMATFSAFGTGAFPEQLPAYDGKYFATIDIDMNGLEFEVGVPG
ncbi:MULTISPECIES: hypothetical protein [Sinorhizobium]|uniref:hypothetical protein n=1 Tax=Sinorhizobium TaxID=28105 RepID=UPI000FDBA00F|nr:MULTISPECIES: hypothetical protein [Sinorhizobium]MBO1965262.1 hypothetical protein [Sinorhizobium medicae]MDW9359072.1 hypothetical protein [Sinorhizobium meliloti]MDW9620233.1 hypothetical protein [Sinorhizobium meliloti]MDW9906065.1 hypothetical protein [Sinorhizobium meliloti]MDW9943148.1 hypothetical protein [Sinorhizobium meliloti]